MQIVIGQCTVESQQLRNISDALDLQPAQWKDWTVSGVRASSVFLWSSAYTRRACYPYYSMAPRPGPSYKLIGKDWIPFMFVANGASCTSVGSTLCPTMKFCAEPACLTSHTLSVNEDWVSFMLPDFEMMYQQTWSSESAPRRGTVHGLCRSGDVPVADHPPPGSTRSAVTRM